MKKYRTILILLNLVFLLAAFNHSVYKKEKLVSNGQLVFLELAPVDPRSLMQGDYMRLSYAIARELNTDSIPQKGFCIVTLNDSAIASRARLQTDLRPIRSGEYAIRYTSGSWSIYLGAESYFFQEGEADKYSNARYGGLRLDGKGESVLVGLYDKNLKKL
ncbi:MAG: GDYXXLXY domain-containing protein [Flavitalea sp.]